MKVFKNGSKEIKGRHTIYVTPGTDCPTVTDFKDHLNKNVMFSIEFQNGIAEIGSQLGNYLIDKGYANRIYSSPQGIIQ